MKFYDIFLSGDDVMDCIFCKIINNEISSYKIYENDMVLCFLDINPLSSGHTLIIPKKHFKDISDIDSKYLSSINDATKYVYNLLMSKLGPDGIRIVQNNGICQEIKHYHVHLIPVYNDMLDMDIEEVYNKIKDSN